MKEYRIVKRVSGGMPYSVWKFKTFETCYFQLLRLISGHADSIRKEYYVTNEFFKNKYPPYLPNITVYTIEAREVDSWREFKKEEKSENHKIIKLFHLQ